MKTVPLIVLLLVAGSLMLACGCTENHPPGTKPAVSPALEAKSPGGLKDCVGNMTDFARTYGKESGIAAIQNRSFLCAAGNVTLFAMNENGELLAFSSGSGQTFPKYLDRNDTYGKDFAKRENNVSRLGGGLLLYRYPASLRNATGRIGVLYIRPVDDTWRVGAGLETTEDRFTDPALSGFVTEAREYALRNGREKALAEFNNVNGSFIRGDLYVFAYDYGGTVLAWPYRPDQIGRNRVNETDPAGKLHVLEMVSTARNGTGLVDYYSVNPSTGATDGKISSIADIDGTWFIGAGRYL